MAEPWTPFCKRRRDYEHAVHCAEDVSCPYCGMANPQFLGRSTTPTNTGREVILIESSPPGQQSASTHRFPQLDKTSETARQQSILRTKQKRPERPHAGSRALSTRPKTSNNSRTQLISQTFAVNISAYYGIIYDLDLHLCHDWTPIHQVASKFSTNDTYTTMDELIGILARDLPNWKLMLAKYKPLQISVATNMDNKQRPIFLPERAAELPIDELLAAYYSSTPHKIILCLACLEEGSELVDNFNARDGERSLKKSRSKEGKGKSKIKMEPKIKSEHQDTSIVKKEKESLTPTTPLRTKRSHSEMSPDASIHLPEPSKLLNMADIDNVGEQGSLDAPAGRTRGKYSKS